MKQRAWCSALHHKDSPLELLFLILTLLLLGSAGLILYLWLRLKVYQARVDTSFRLLKDQARELAQLRLFSSRRQKSFQLEVRIMQEMSAALAHCADFEQAVQVAFSRMLEGLSADIGILHLGEHPESVTDFYWGTGSHLEETLESIATRGIVLQDRPKITETSTFEDFQSAKDLKPIESVCSLLGFACRARGRRVGEFLVAYQKPHRYTDSELRCLQYCAERFGEAFDALQSVKQSESLDQLRQDYVANLSHELRTPLTVIYGYLAILKSYPEQLFQQHEKHEMVAVMTEECQRLIRLINNLLLSAKVEREDFPKELKPVPVSLAEVVGQTCRFMEHELRSKGIEVLTDIPKDLALIKGNYDLLYQVFQNLVSNSIKFCSTEPRIEITAKQEEDYVIVSVSDNGLGIDPSALPRLFQRFYRGESSASKRPGLGIGLYLVKKLVELHRGHISVTSELNKGTTFLLRFPALSMASPLSRQAAG
ncbi:MAG: HAMP domain-containing sensor histidine kinase [Acidobacteriota bacterium]